MNATEDPITIDMLLRRHAAAPETATSPAVITRKQSWTWSELLPTLAQRSDAFEQMLSPDAPPHVGLLMDNTAEMTLAVIGAGLGSYVAVGLNSTRRGESLAADIRKSDCQVVLTDNRHAPLLHGLELGGVEIVNTDEPSWVRHIDSASNQLPQTQPSADSLFMLVFTSGTSGNPKAVRITHEKITRPGYTLNDRFGLGREDVRYLSMPLFHSNALMACWALALVSGAPIAVAEKFSASGFLDDIRRFNASYTSYVGKPLAYVLSTPEREDDSDNPLRLVFGNEASERDIAEFSRRFNCRVVDGFGSSENAVVISRLPETPSGALGWPADGVAVYHPENHQECPRAVIVDGVVTNLDEATGELVNVNGAGQFAGYYNDDAATAERLRGGMYWSGDLGYRDADGWIYFAGRDSDWLRVDGENLAAAPIERVLSRHPLVEQVAVYALPDDLAGDQLVAAMTLRGDLGIDEWTNFLHAQDDLGTKSFPRYVRILGELPRTATNKILKRQLQADGIGDVGTVWVREERGRTYSIL